IAWLDQERPVVILSMLSASFYNPSWEGVVDPAPGEQPEPKRRHAVIACGYGTIKSQRALLVRNSWGPGWALNGYGWLTERFLAPRLYDAAVLLENVHVSG